MTEENKLQETLRKALEMEEKGFDFYAEMSQKSRNDITKRTFGFLRDQEKLHKDAIKNFYLFLKEKGEFPELELNGKYRERSEELTIFANNIRDLKEKIQPSDEDKRACEFAMEFENSGYRYYEKMLEEARDTNLIKLLKFLLDEESRHYKGIESLYTYLTDSENWFMYNEGSFPQGG